MEIVKKLEGRIEIPVAAIQFDVSGHTIWVQSPEGATVLRIKARRGIEVEECLTSPVRHADIYIEGNLPICLSKDSVQS
jgi:hypothetical protein